MSLKGIFAAIFSVVFSAVLAFGQPGRSVSARSVTIVTEPNASVWMDDIFRGVTDESGKLVIKTIPAGMRRMRVRANSFKETSVPLLPAQKGEVKIALVKTTDEAEIAFQEAELLTLRDREKAIAAYRKAISLRPKFPEAQVALARVLSAAGDSESALEAIAAARRARPAYAEASAVEGRIHKSNDEEEKAIASYKRAITEGKGFQPEAHAGLGIIYKDKAEAIGFASDMQEEKDNYYNLAAGELRKSLTQLSGAPDAKDIYQLLGDLYYRAKRYQDAINTYEEFIRVFPDSTEVITMRSLIEQTRKEMNGNQ